MAIKGRALGLLVAGGGVLFVTPDAAMLRLCCLLLQLRTLHDYRMSGYSRV